MPDHCLTTIDTDEADLYAADILPAKYEGIDSLPAFVERQNHLTRAQQQQLLEVLQGHDELFSPHLSKYPGKKIHLTLQPGAQPHHSKPYPVPQAHKDLFLKEADHLVKEGVLKPCGSTAHGYPTFITPKKDGRIRWVSDFRKLNAMLVRETYVLPRIQDILRRRSKYKYFTKLDISMQFYTFELDEESSWLCVIVTPFGKYRYLRLPMGICNSPDYAQEIMETVFKDMRDDLEVYIDDIGIFDDDYDEHMRKLRKALSILQDNGFRINPLKCEWAVQETDWLGYWFTPHGIKPWRKKVQAILDLKPPTNMTELRSFIGAVNFYRDMWPKRAHKLTPLTSLTGKGPFQWTDEHQKAFDDMKATMAADALLNFPDHKAPFHIYTDASDYQLGAVIMQHGRPLAYYSRKLSPAQRNYTTMEKELLSATSTCKEFRTLLLGKKVHIHTDHKNLTYTNLNTQRVLRWRLYLEEFAPEFHYIPGPDNVLADYLSRAPTVGTPLVEKGTTEFDISSADSMYHDNGDIKSEIFQEVFFSSIHQRRTKIKRHFSSRAALN